MFSWNPRRYWELWPYEMPLHHFPGHPQLPQEPALQRPMRQLRATYTLHFDAMAEADQYERAEKLTFMKRCYLLAALFTVAGQFQWLLLAGLLDKHRLFCLPGFICMVLALAALILLTFCMRWRSHFWYVCLFSSIFVETIVLSIVLLLPERTIVNILAATASSLAGLILFYLLGALLPMIVLPGIVVFSVILIVFTLASVTVLILFIVTDQQTYHSIYFGILFFATMPMCLFHAQIVHGRRYQLPKEEYVTCAVIIYMHHVLFFMAIYYYMWVFDW
ncbi:hypothetical protein AWZ03_007343 [Drosophila navojoa]|uniref:Uncharacterized protein n=1 Tax=Drosophila navojoa TaxID=7232 RepID=A0A484BBP3_DRONA|nr:uncharacterized protein LOC115562777 [Drosophila navojoa]TDG46267.1 hypothetical protein AWZ03_007343 [Drosophila navojoa]